MRTWATADYERERLRTLESYGVMDTAPETCFDDLTALTAHVVGAPIALLSLVDGAREWFKSCHGQTVAAAPREASFGGHLVSSREPLIVADVACDRRFQGNPLTRGEPHVAFYAGVPLQTPDGFVLGALCAIDRRPRPAPDLSLQMMERLARQAVDQLELRRERLVEARYQAIIDSSDDAIVGKDLGGIVSSWNPAAERLFGYTADEMIGASIMRIIPDDRRDEERSIIQRIVRSEVVRHYETVRRTKSGALVEVSVSVSPIKNPSGVIVGASKIARDITAWRAQAASLARSEARLQAVVQTAADPILTVDEEGAIETANGAAERMFGYPEAELIGRDVRSLIGRPPGAGGANGVGLGPLALGDAGGEAEAFHRDGARVPVEVSVGAMSIDGRRMYTGILHDVSARKRAASRLEASLKEKEVLLQEVHHRVKNNLQLVASLINLQVRTMQEGHSNAQPLLDCKARVETIALIHEQLYQASDYGQISFREYVTTLVTRIVTATAPAALGVQLAIDDLTLDVGQAIPCGVLINELVTNAVKHGVAGERPGSVRVSLEAKAGGCIDLRVADDGPGLPASFDPSRNGSLGFQLVEALVAQLDGQLEVGSSAAGGASFRVTFTSDQGAGA